MKGANRVYSRQETLHDSRDLILYRTPGQDN